MDSLVDILIITVVQILVIITICSHLSILRMYFCYGKAECIIFKRKTGITTIPFLRIICLYRNI